MLSRIFGPNKDEVKGEYPKLHNEERNDLYPLPNIIQVIKSGIMRWAGHVACMGGQERCIQGFDGERDHLEYPGIDGRIKLRWIFKKWDWEAWTGLIWLRIGTVGRFL